MSDQTSIFENKPDNQGDPSQTKPGTSNTSGASTESELTDLLNGIKNERGEPKYKTLKDALVGLQNAQTHIPDLKKTLSDREAEVERLRKEAERVADLEEAVRKLTEQRESGTTPPSTLSEQEIAELVKKSLDTTLTQRETQAKQAANISTVVSSLKSAFGDTAETKFNEKAAELGLSVAEFNALAAKSPKVVLTALGITTSTKKDEPSGTKGTVNTSGMTQNPQTFVGRNKSTVLLGASSDTLKEEAVAAKKMVEELHSSGRTVHDLTNPKEYFKFFGAQ